MNEWVDGCVEEEKCDAVLEMESPNRKLEANRHSSKRYTPSLLLLMLMLILMLLVFV
jgi:hypothetical protein